MTKNGGTDTKAMGQTEPQFLSDPMSDRKTLKNQPIRNKNRQWWPCLLTDRDEMSIRNRGLSINASYQVSVHLTKRFQTRRFFKICTRDKCISNTELSFFSQKIF